MKRTLSTLAPLVLASALLAGCSSSDDGDAGTGPDPDAASTAAGSPSPSATDEPALLTLSADATGTTCFADGVPDLAWFEVQWRSLAELDSFRFDLVGSHGVRTIGSGWIVPPVNYGGRIDYSGSALWQGWRRAINDRVLSASQMDQVAFWVPSEGQSGLLVLHLRFDPKVVDHGGATIDGVRATYRTNDGRTGETTVHIGQRFDSDCKSGAGPTPAA
ncbi:MAG: hypothetical protein H6529_02240 [Nocardioides sp.]|nr:hypothetical protein [Nocardioidaceae bacterium]MCB8955285.1 hypothetical protein [Nocardioides sp.]